MEDTVSQVYPLVQLAVVGLVAVVYIIALIVQMRTRPFSPLGLGLRAALAIAGFIAVLLVSGVQLNWLWAAVFAVVGAALGFAFGRTSKRSLDDQGRRVIKRSPWPAIAGALAYTLAAWALVYAAGGVFSVAMLVVLFAALMQTGAVVAEITGSNSGSAPLAA